MYTIEDTTVRRGEGCTSLVNVGSYGHEIYVRRDDVCSDYRRQYQVPRMHTTN